MFNRILENAGNTLQHVVQAYHPSTHNPSPEELTRIRTSIAALDVLGRIGIAVSIAMTIVACVVQRIYFVGPLLAVAMAIVDLAVFFLSLDAFRVTNNIQTNYVDVTDPTRVPGRTANREDFKIEVTNRATANTFLARILYGLTMNSREEGAST